jgi:hypothetical protein
MKRLPIILLVSVFILTACAPVATPTPTATATVLPTATLTLQPTVTVTPSLSEIPIEDGDNYDGNMESVVNSADSRVKLNLIKQATNYWVDVLELFNRENIIGYKPIFNSVDGNKVDTIAWVLQVSDPQSGAITMKTVAAGDFRNPEVVSMLPIDVSAGDDQHLLMFGAVVGQGDTFKRMDQQGVITEFMDKSIGAWKKVEKFADLSECRSWFDAIEKCPATLADINSGRLVNFAKKVMKPFPPDAYEAFPILDSGTTVTMYDPVRTYNIIPLKFVSLTKGLNNASFSSPLSPVGDKLFFLVKSENTSELPFDLLALVVKLKTKSGKDGYYVLVCPPEFDNPNKVDKQKTFNTYYEWIDKMAYQPPYYNPREIKSQYWSEHTEKRSTFIRSIIEDVNSNRKKLMDEWVNTGDIPVELEKIPLYPYINGKEGWGFSKR